jgi:putative FmdB family regulatory protein
MANYTYRCVACGREVILNVPMDERDNDDVGECEICGCPELKRQLDKPNWKVRDGQKGGRRGEK